MDSPLLIGVINRAFAVVPLDLFAVFGPLVILFVARAVRERATHRLWQFALVVGWVVCWAAGSLLSLPDVWVWRGLGALLLLVAVFWGRRTRTRVLAWEQEADPPGTWRSGEATGTPSSDE